MVFIVCIFCEIIKGNIPSKNSEHKCSHENRFTHNDKLLEERLSTASRANNNVNSKRKWAATVTFL